MVEKVNGESLRTIRELTLFDMDEILPLYAAVGWTNYTDRPEMLKNAFEHSLLVLGAYLSLIHI